MIPSIYIIIYINFIYIIYTIHCYAHLHTCTLTLSRVPSHLHPYTVTRTFTLAPLHCYAYLHTCTLTLLRVPSHLHPHTVTRTFTLALLHCYAYLHICTLTLLRARLRARMNNTDSVSIHVERRCLELELELEAVGRRTHTFSRCPLSSHLQRG